MGWMRVDREVLADLQIPGQSAASCAAPPSLPLWGDRVDVRHGIAQTAGKSGWNLDNPTESTAALYHRLQFMGTNSPDEWKPRIQILSLEACRNG